LKWFGSPFVGHLQQENQWLRARVEALEAALLPQKVPAVTAGEVIAEKQRHHITKSKGAAACSCGERIASLDPVVVQQWIATHYRSTLAPIQPKRTSWADARSQAEHETPEQERKAASAD
jgi:hypothetical protein